MKRRSIIFMVLLLVVVMLFTSCKHERILADGNIANESQKMEDTNSVVDTEPDEDTSKKYDTEGDVIESTNISQSSEGKVIHKRVEEYGELKGYGDASYFSQEHENVVLEFLETHISKQGESLSDDTFVFAEERIYGSYVPNCDYGEWLANSSVRCFLLDKLTYYPTEAVRKTDDGKYCVVYDLDTNMRVFAWYFQNTEGWWYEQFGYPIYMAETLSYSDFEGLELKDYSTEVEKIDPKVTEIHLRKHINNEEVYHTKIAIQNGYPPRSLHLLTDGLLIITYGRDETGFYITDIEFHEDFTIDTVAGPQCCKIDPLDYVTQG